MPNFLDFMNLRFRIVALMLISPFIVVIIRLFYWQVVKGEDLASQAKRQHQIGKTVNAPRGNILAGDGSILAGREEGWLVFAYLPDIKEGINKIADLLAPFLIDKKDGSGDLAKLTYDQASQIKLSLDKKDVWWVPLKRSVTNETKKNIEALKINGIGFESEDLRIYPEASSAAHLMGFVGKDEAGDNKGYFGLEGYYDLMLSGKPGYRSRDADVAGVPILTGNQKEVTAISGIDLVTHIQKGIQINVETKLKKGIETYGAKAGTVIVANPKDGAIYALASYPSYDPGKYYEWGDEYFKNPAISDAFEPGSVFKVIVMAAALDAGVIKPDTKCDMCNGPAKVDKYLIETWNQKYHPDATMTEVIVNSDNVGMVFVGQKLGALTLYDYLDRFGIGSPTGIDLEGEANPGLRDKSKWNVVDLATATFGQGIAVTPIQLVKAVAAIANKGVLYKPQVVDKLKLATWEEDIKPESEGRVISENAALDITAMMAEAAKSGESKWTYMGGFRVAGKTGTAQIPISGHYDDEKTIASFIGFAPYDDPKFVMLVTLKEPQTSPWASETAAPLWYNIARDLFIYFGIQPN